MSFSEQVKALLIKDFQVAKRNRVATISEMIVPIFAASIAGVLILVLSIISTDGDEWSDTHPIGFSTNTSFIESPDNAAFAKEYLDAVDTQIGALNFSFTKSAAGVPVYLETLIASNLTHDNAFGVNATTTDKNKNELHLTYATILSQDSSVTAGSIGTILGSLLFNKDATTQRVDNNVLYNTWYRPLYLDINLRAVFASSGMLMLLYAFIPSALINGGRLVAEKKAKVRESLRVMGVTDSAYLFAHFISMFIRLFLGCVLIAVVLLAFKAIDASAVLPVLGLSVIFCFSMICEAQMMPALFSADVWTNVFNIFFIAGSAALSQFTTGSSKGVQILVCLLSPSGYYYAILPYLAKGSIQLHLTSGEAAIIMIVDSIVYFSIATYVYNVFPGEFGVPRSKLFFLEWMWKSNEHKKVSSKNINKGRDSQQNRNIAPTTITTTASTTADGAVSQTNSLNAQSPPSAGAGNNARNSGELEVVSPRNDDNINTGDDDIYVNIRGLVKHFDGAPAPSVNKLDLVIKRAEVYSLLGHNGAGKTTAISMMTGILNATDYEEATINGYDMRTEMDLIRKDIGLTPQFDVLFDELTAREHLELFAQLKGRKADHPYIEELMKALSLPDDNFPCKVYSGGTKRRLSVGNALVGGSKFVLLDEPSSGMDPVSRRKMWALIKQEKKRGRTILLTTHFLEEADFLSDTLNILSLGTSKVCATATELKHKYDVGYTLTCSKADRDVSGQPILELVKKHCKEASMKIDSDGEVQFLVPTEDLTPLLVELEEKQSQLRIESYGINSCTLEDVFVRLATEDSEEKKANLKKKKNGNNDNNQPESPSDADGNYQLITAEIEEEFERKYSLAQAQSASSKVWYQTKMTLSRCFSQLSRSMPIKVFAVIFPLFLMALGFLTLRPNENSKNSFFGKTYDWINFETEELNLVMVDLHHDQNGPYIGKFEDEFGKIWREKMNPNQQINWYRAESYTDFSTGQYVPLYGFTFTGPKSPPVYGGVMPHGWDATNKAANYSMLWTQRYDPVLSIPLAACFRAAMDKTIGLVTPTENFHRDNFTFVPQKIDYEALIEKFTHHSAKDLAGSSKDEKTYNIMVLGLYFVISIGQLVAATQRGFADELSRKIFRVLMLNGLHPLAHVIGNFIFSFIVSLWCLLILIIGLFMQKIDSVTDNGVLGPVFIAAVLFVIHTILFDQWIIAYFPGKTPIFYTLMTHLYNILSMGGPYLIDKLFDVGNFPFQKGFRPYLLSFFPSCAFYHVFDVAASVKPSQAQASRLFEFGNDDVTENAKTGWCFVFLGLELLIPLVLLHGFVNNSGVYAWVSRRREGSSEKDQSTADFKKSMGEQEALLADHHHNGNSTNSFANSDKYTQITVPRKNEDPLVLNVEELEDDDVRNERSRTSRQPSQLTLDHVRKTFDNGKKVAVNNLSLGLEEGSTLSILGPNSAGKSTTCNMIMRELAMTSGSIEYLKGEYSVAKTPMLECYSKIRLGCCIQTDSLWEYFYAREHLEYYLRLRLLDQYDASEWRSFIDRCLESIELNDVETKEAGGYSGGMKRKLQVALCMNTFPKLAFLDEPSTGMDAFARRALWKVIKNATKSKASIILTTHSMDEAENVSSKICCLTNSGVMRCIGTPQHLKSKYGKNFIVTTELDSTLDFTDKESFDKAVEKIRVDLSNMFDEASLIENVGSLCRFRVATMPSLAKAFQELDKKKSDWNVKTYNVSQMADLEQIFVNMVKTGGGSLDDEAM